MSYFAAEKVEELAWSENLDRLLEVEEDCKPGEVYYCTVHGFRSLDSTRCHLNQFVVTNKGNGFLRARNLPYVRLPATKCELPQLIVQNLDAQAEAAGYAAAVSLPYIIASISDEYLEGTLIVRITEDIEELADSGYANAVPLPYSPGSVYIQRIDMLDTEYAAMLEAKKYDTIL